MLCDKTLLPVTCSETPEGNFITFCTDDLGRSYLNTEEIDKYLISHDIVHTTP